MGAGGEERAAPVVLITGCSSGIGRAAAVNFARKGWRVFATMRGAEARGASLRDEAREAGWHLTTPELDVTSDRAVSDAVSAALALTEGRLDVLVNNAGYFCYGPIEQTSPDELRAQLETNVIGVLRVTRAVLPTLRARQAGAIVTLSSVSGRVVVPVAGPYHVSKHALEAMVEALRYELVPFGIRVVLVEPGPYRTDLHTKEIQTMESREADSPYAAIMQAYRRQAARLERDDPDEVVEVIYRAATSPRPRLRWPVGPSSLSGTLGRRLAPDGIYEWLLKAMFPLRPSRRT